MRSLPPPTPRRLRPLLAAALGVCLVCAAACDRNAPRPVDSTATDTPRGPQQPRTSPPLPPVASSHGPAGAPDAARAGAQGWTLLDGRRARAADYKGKVLVLDFWATYCPPCREEVPHLLALQKRYGAQGLNVVGLNVGGDEDKPKVADFVKEFKISYQLGYPDDALASIVFAERDDIPQTYVFDRNGRLVERFFGYGPRVAEGLERAVQVALASKSNEGD